MNDFWASLKAKMKAAQEWMKQVFASMKANQKGAAEQDGESLDRKGAPS